ncbi:MAG: hypothetical protein KatS3mg068_1658 [Candidatus Sericytochromatia bacterium]|nr:MAG: hypothetical protein KatS3mg068_1658 [Candidatus Sericytochromatia bacterium]
MSIFKFIKKEKTKLSNITIKDITKVLNEVIDPETNINIIDLGLIYDIKIYKEKINIKMTMTTPICPMTSYLIDSVIQSIKEIVDIPVDVELVWEPRWNREMISEEVKNHLV